MSRFQTTSWNIVLDAKSGDSVVARLAMARLYERYWLPLYAYCRHRGYSQEDARDLTQEFFTVCLEKDWISRACKEKGKFRTFLLTCLERFLGNQQKRERALKRGGHLATLPIDAAEAEKRIALDDSKNLSAAAYFDRTWAISVMEHALKDLSEQYSANKNPERFELLRLYLLPGTEPPSYEELAERLRLTPNAAKVAVHRIRAKFRENVRAEVAAALPPDGDLNEEIRYLASLLRGN